MIRIKETSFLSTREDTNVYMANLTLAKSSLKKANTIVFKLDVR